MSLYKRKDSPYWWVKLAHDGRRIQQSTGAADKAKAREYHDKLKASLWDQERLGIKPSRTWNKAVVRYLAETSHKASHSDDKGHLRWVDRFLNGVPLDRINRDVLERSKVSGRRAVPRTPRSTARWKWSGRFSGRLRTNWIGWTRPRGLGCCRNRNGASAGSLGTRPTGSSQRCRSIWRPWRGSPPRDGFAAFQRHGPGMVSGGSRQTDRMDSSGSGQGKTGDSGATECCRCDRDSRADRQAPEACV